jgi:hypothetical protein
MPLLTGSAAADSDLAVVVDVSASLNKRMTLAGLGEALFRFAPNGSLNLALLDQGSTTKLAGTVLQVGSVPADRLEANSITAEQIGPNAIGSSELADGAVDTAALQNASVTEAILALGAVTASRIADGAVTGPAIALQAVGFDKLRHTQAGNVILGRASSTPGAISEIPCSAAGRQLLAAADAAAQRAAMGLGPLAVAQGEWASGSSFSGTSSGTNTGDQTITLVGAITGTGTGLIETTLAPGAITAGLLAPGSVNQAAMGDAAVTASALADNSATIISDESPNGTGAFAGQSWFSPSTARHWVWGNGQWGQTSGLTSLSFEPGLFTAQIDYPDPFTASVALSIPSQASGLVLVGPESGESAAPGFRRLAGADLPPATTLLRGAVRLGEGLQADGDGLASLAPATDLLRGGVSVPAGALTVSSAGALDHATSPLAAGTYTKVTLDQWGHAIDARGLDPADIPTLDASILGSGTLAQERFGAKSILRQALADNSISFIQESDPGIQENPHRGCLWLRESTGQLRMWNSNSWLPIGFGALAEENLRYCGTFDADLGTISTLTLFGVGEGFVVGQAVPAATDPRAGVYLVCDTTGDSVGVLSGTTFDPGDWILCNGSSGWVRIDSALGSSSGGGASNLDDLLDVAAASPVAGDLLGRSSGGVWINIKPPTTYLAVADGGSPTTGQLGAEQILVSNSNTDPALFIKRANGTVARIAGAGAIGIPGAASTSAAGTVQLATNTQALAGTSTNLALVPAALAHVLDNRPATTAAAGLIRLATSIQAAAGLEAGLAITPATLAPLLAAKASSAAATTTAAGLIELATPEEAAAGLDATRAITPATLAPLLSATGAAPASTTVLGLVRLATTTQVNDGTSDLLAVTPATLQARTATTSRSGLIALASQVQVNAGTDAERAVTAATLQARLAALFGSSSSYVKGALLAGASSGALGVLAPAANGLFLQLDSTAPLGVRWVAAPGGVSQVTGSGAISVANQTTTPAITVAAASTTAAGVVQLNTSISSTSTSQAATASAVKAAADLAASALPAAGGTITGNVANTATGFLGLPVGTTAQRSSSPTPGMIRFNASLGGIEWRTADAWVSSTTLAGLDSPSFTGAPSAPTASPGTNTTQLATTAFVAAAVAAVTGGGGAATTATRLATPRNIFGNPFDGTAAIGGQLSDVTNIVGRSSESMGIYPGASNRSIFFATWGSGSISLNTDPLGAINIRGGFVRLDAGQQLQLVKRDAGSGDKHVAVDVSQITANRTLQLADGGTVLTTGTMVATTRTVSAGSGLLGGGNLGANIFLSLGGGSDITNTSANTVSGTTHAHRIDGSALIASFAGAIGSYALAKYEAAFGSASVNTNETTSGSNLRWSAGNGNGLWSNNTISLSGTWRLMSRSVVAQADHGLWQRIS